MQRAGIEALQGPQDAVDMMLRTFDERRKLIVRLLNEVPGISCITPKGAFYAFPNITGTGMSSRELADLLLYEAGVACLSGTAFGAHGEGYLRFSYANSLANIDEALRRVIRVAERWANVTARPQGSELGQGIGISNRDQGPATTSDPPAA